MVTLTRHGVRVTLMHSLLFLLEIDVSLHLPRLLPLCGALILVGHSGHRLLRHRLFVNVYRLLVRVHGLLEARLLVRRDEAEDAPKLPAKGAGAFGAGSCALCRRYMCAHCRCRQVAVCALCSIRCEAGEAGEPGGAG